MWFVFYDRRHHSDNNTDVYMAVSVDGGNSFENFIVSDSSFLPATDVFMGDYIGVTAYDNEVRPIWTRVENGTLSLLTALVSQPEQGL
ncbi:MAG: hypothetical protein GY765_16520 [bacterium]|nr:hypothetical protein [bacterium]